MAEEEQPEVPAQEQPTAEQPVEQPEVPSEEPAPETPAEPKPEEPTEPEQPTEPEVPSEPEVPVKEEPKEELDGVAILEKMAESVAKLKEQEKAQVEKIALLEAEVKSLQDASSKPSAGGTYSEEQMNALLGKANKEHADAVAALKLEHQNALDAKQAEMLQKVSAIKVQTKAIIEQMDASDDKLAEDAKKEIDAL